MTVLDCIVHQHNIWLVLLSALLCLAGSWVTMRLFDRATHTHGRQRFGWYFLTALTAGTVIWSAHCIGILAFNAGVPIALDPVMTSVSLLIAMMGSTVGFVLAGSRLFHRAGLAGGIVVGLSIAAMHYTGMMAYRVQGVVSWDMNYLVASIVLSVVFAAAALHLATQENRRSLNDAAMLLTAAIIALHFTGMTGFHVQPTAHGDSFTDPAVLHALALAVAGMAHLIVATGLTSFLIDGSTRAESVERLRVMALTDTLTSLPNRANFNDRLDLEMELASQRRGQLALIGIDLNRFKDINDLRGHAAGDEVLRVLGLRMKGLLHENAGEFVARTGGDEFSALYRIAPDGSPSDFIARLEAALFHPIRLDGSEVLPGASIGVAIWPDDAHDKVSLVNNADLAMYRAKADPMRHVCFYEAGMDQKVRERRALASDLRGALANDELSLHYQVQTTVNDGRIRGYEALLRWNHPEIGNIPPAEFIPIAEENGMILEIGEWVLRTACREAAAWSPGYTVAVNMSAVQFIHTDLPKLVMDTLLESGLPPDRLELELTETTIFADRDRALHILRQIKALGVSIALDDFGTGYSSLDTLRAFPFDRIKIDRSFFSSTEASPQTTAIIRAVLALGKSFGIPVLAEGIETYDQLSMLSAEGCDEAQGFLLGRPASLDQIMLTGQLRSAMPDPADTTPLAAAALNGSAA